MCCGIALGRHPTRLWGPRTATTVRLGQKGENRGARQVGQPAEGASAGFLEAEGQAKAGDGHGSKW